MNYSDLSDEQKAVVNAKGGMVRVRAGAGTGKTTTIGFRIAKVIEQGIPPDQILAMSFTKQASREISERAAHISHSMPVDSTTIHGMAVRLLRKYSGLYGIPVGFIILTEDDTKPMFEEVVTNWARRSAQQPGRLATLGLAQRLYKACHITPLEEGSLAAEQRTRSPGNLVASFDPDDEAKDESLNSLISAAVRPIITHWKENAFTAQDALEHYKNTDRDEEILVEIYSDFQKRLEEQNSYEISDLIPAAIRLMLQDDTIREEVSKSKRVVLVDEFQDVNLGQVKFINLLVSYHKNLTIVGDDDQSLYMFRHSIPDAMERSRRMMPDIAEKAFTDFTLSINRRSPDSILSLANCLVEHNPRPNPKELSSGRDGLTPKFLQLKSDKEEADHIVRSISEKLANGSRLSDFAILCRNMRPLQTIIREMLVAKIPFKVKNGETVIESKVARDIMAWLRFAANPKSSVSFMRLLKSPNRGIGEVAAASILKVAIANDDNILEAMRETLEVAKLTSKVETALSDIIDAVHFAQSLFERGSVHIKSSLIELLAITGYQDYLAGIKNEKDRHTQEHQLKEFFELADAMGDSGVMPLMDFLDDIMLNEQGEETEEGYVYIGTMHGSKGLEWDNVYLIGVQDGILPSTKKGGASPGEYDPWEFTTGCLEEERRLLHVGMTRARNECHMTSAYYRKALLQKCNTRSQFHHEMYNPPRRSAKGLVGRTNTRSPGSFYSRSGIEAMARQ